MLSPIVICYLVLIALISVFYQPLPWEWFVLLGNFQNELSVHGVAPYWFVSAYVQIVGLATLPFLIPAVRRSVALRPLLIGLVCLGAIIVMGAALNLDDIPPQLRLRHPVAGLELMAAGWCSFFARTVVQKVLVTAVVLAMWGVGWWDMNLSSTILILAGALAVIWNLHIKLPSAAVRWLTWFGSLTMFIYLMHVPAVSLVTRTISWGDSMMFVTVMIVTVLSAVSAKGIFNSASNVVQGMMR